jgi:uncharacterized protein YegP (UPF0339 family)
MRKIICLFALSAGIGVMTLPEVPTAEAQVKAKTDTKAKAAPKVGTVEVYKGKDGYRFRIKDAEGKVLAISSGRGAETKEAVHDKLEAVKETLNKVKITDVKEEKE